MSGMTPTPTAPMTDEALDAIERTAVATKEEIRMMAAAIRHHRSSPSSAWRDIKALGRAIIDGKPFRAAFQSYISAAPTTRVAVKRELLEELRVAHTSCPDTWYSCPKSQDGCSDDRQDLTKCNCGADEHNAKISALLAADERNVRG